MKERPVETLHPAAGGAGRRVAAHPPTGREAAASPAPSSPWPSAPGTTNAPDYLLLGNATGGFATQPIPETTAGGGDRAYALDYNHDGLTDFLVLNGQVPNSGPIQLLTPQPTT